jgi:hypothetical protein
MDVTVSGGMPGPLSATRMMPMALSMVIASLGAILASSQASRLKYSFSEYIGRRPLWPEDAERIAGGLAKGGLLS